MCKELETEANIQQVSISSWEDCKNKENATILVDFCAGGTMQNSLYSAPGVVRAYSSSFLGDIVMSYNELLKDNRVSPGVGKTEVGKAL